MKNKSAKTTDRIFRFDNPNYKDETDLRNDFNNYFANLPNTNNKPFDCPYLRVLQESVGIIFSNKPSWRYELEDLICVQNAKKDTSRRCRFGGVSGEEGVRYVGNELKFYCPTGNLDIVIPLRINKGGHVGNKLKFYCPTGNLDIVIPLRINRGGHE